MIGPIMKSAPAFPESSAALSMIISGFIFSSLEEEMSELIKRLHPAISTMVENQLPNDQIKWGL